MIMGLLADKFMSTGMPAAYAVDLENQLIADFASKSWANGIDAWAVTVNAFMATPMSGTQVSSDWNATTGVAQILNKPSLFSGAYTDLTGKPSLAAVAFSGAYSDLTGAPSASQVPADWNATTGVARILNKPTLFDGTWDSLSNKPWLFSGNYSDLMGRPSLFSGAYADLTGKPALFSGSYTDLTNKPTIPAAQVSADWTASTGVAQILNKPALFSGAYADLTGKPTLFDGAWGSLTGKPTFAPVATTGSYSDLSNKPTIPTILARSFANPARTLNTAFQISTTRDASVSYSVNISVSSALLAGQEGRAHLEYADDSGFTANVVTLASAVNSTAGVLNLTNVGTGNLSGWIPAGKYARIRTENITGTPAYSLTRTQEVLQ